MDYIEDFSQHNMKNKLDAESYVDNNILRLFQLYNLDDQDDISSDEKRDHLVQYFTQHPEEIKRYSSMSFGVTRNSFSIPTTNNIGGVIKYR